MCLIFGILSRKDGEVSPFVNPMLNAFSYKPKKSWLVTPGAGCMFVKEVHPETQAPMGKLALGQISSEKPCLSLGDKLALLCEGRIYDDSPIKLLEEKYRGDLSEALGGTLGLLDGEYALAASDGSKIVVARDSLGRKPVFYDQNEEIIAFASEKKVLWGIGLRNVKPLRAGTLAFLGEDGIAIGETHKLGRIGIEINNLDTAVNEYERLLRIGVEKRLKDVERVGVLLSGGVDSCLLTQLVSEIAADRGIEVIAYTAGMPNAIDILYAERFAQELGLNHKVRRLELSEVESYLPQVIRVVEERDFVQIETGIGVYAAEEMAAQDGIKVIFSGQGPDELWGGYRWYPQVIAEEGYEGLLQRMWGDLERADIETFDRENKIAVAHGIEVIFPFADTQVVKFAMSVSPELKINSPQDNLGKRPHRELAERVGVPQEFAQRGKDAAQHGTGIHEVLDEIARRNGFDPDLVKRIGYQSEEVSSEKLASSSRYGYRYAAKGLWEVSDYIQLFLDTMAYRNNLLNRKERTVIENLMQKLSS